MSATQRDNVGTLASSNVIAAAEKVIGRNSGGNYFFEREDPIFAPQNDGYLAIVATGNMYLNVIGEGAQVATPKGARVRVYGYRAQASASQYAALVQSELLSA